MFVLTTSQNKYLYYLYLQGADLTKPIDKKLYKGISPTCHDFNSTAITEDSLPLIVGFSTGLVQLIDPVRKDVSILFNEEVSYLYILVTKLNIKHFIKYY